MPVWYILRYFSLYQWQVLNLLRLDSNNILIARSTVFERLAGVVSETEISRWYAIFSWLIWLQDTLKESLINKLKKERIGLDCHEVLKNREKYGTHGGRKRKADIAALNDIQRTQRRTVSPLRKRHYTMNKSCNYYSVRGFNLSSVLLPATSEPYTLLINGVLQLQALLCEPGEDSASVAAHIEAMKRECRKATPDVKSLLDRMRRTCSFRIAEMKGKY